MLTYCNYRTKAGHPFAILIPKEKVKGKLMKLKIFNLLILIGLFASACAHTSVNSSLDGSQTEASQNGELDSLNLINNYEIQVTVINKNSQEQDLFSLINKQKPTHYSVDPLE